MTFKVGDRVVIINEESNYVGVRGTVAKICDPTEFFDYLVKTDNLEGNPTPFSTWELRLRLVKENDDAHA